MPRDSTLLLIFLAPAIAQFVLAFLLDRRPDQAMVVKSRQISDQRKSDRGQNTPRQAEWLLILEFAYRPDYFRRWVLVTVFGGALLAIAGLYLTAIAVFLGLPLQAALIHLRCPGCDTATTLRGVNGGRHCLACRQRLHY